MAHKPFLHITWIAFALSIAACTPSNEVENNQSKSNLSALVGTPYFSLLGEDTEVFGRYLYTDMHLFLDSARVYTYYRNNEPNTIYLDHEQRHSFMVKDACEMEADGREAQFHLNRTYYFNSGADSIIYSAKCQFQDKEPIVFIRPYATKCDPIPMCYYQDMEIEWNADESNQNGVVVIAEWLGGTVFDQSVPITIVNADILTDNGQAVLSNDLFDRIPNEALVNLWLLRADVSAFESNDDSSIEEQLLSVLNNSTYPTTEQNEIISYIRRNELPMSFNGSVALLPIILIRNLEN